MAETYEDQQDILGDVVQLFWKKGYSGCSMEELVQATGASRYRFYEYFGSKRALFLAALDYYHAYHFQPPLSIIADEDAGLDEIKAFFARRTLHACSEQGRYGCMIFNSFSDPGAFDLDVALQLRSYRNPLLTLFIKALQNGQTAGTVRNDVSASSLAAQLYNQLFSMMSLSRLKDHEDIIEQSVHATLKGLETTDKSKLASEIRKQLSALNRQATTR